MRRLIPWLRARRVGWSADTDRAFHDALFAAHDHDAFSPAYTGNITIRRFADLAEPYVDGCARVVDVGCGLGEITCELARRRPQTRFLGVDHSRAGVAGARANAERLDLDNVTFEETDMERFDPGAEVDLVAMFDAFHHLLDAAAFVDRMARWTRRFLLIEPQGDWKGSWVRDLDLDWLARDLERVRARLAHAVAEPVATTPAATTSRDAVSADPSCDAVDGEPVENRYSIEDFEKLFAGYGLEMRGTVSGLDEYPPEPTLDTPSRRVFGELAYRAYRAADELLFDNNLDLHAKHLVIYAEQGAAFERRARPDPLPSTIAKSRLRGGHDVEYLGYDGPRRATAGDTFRARVRLRNRSFRPLSSDDADHPDMLSYHWLDERGRDVVVDGERSRLPRAIEPGAEVEVALRLRAPAKTGRYVLAIDLVQEGRTWFRDAGSPTLDVPFAVNR